MSMLTNEVADRILRRLDKPLTLVPKAGNDQHFRPVREPAQEGVGFAILDRADFLRATDVKEVF